MGPWLDAFVATFGIIGLGAVLRRRLLTEASVWAGMEKLVFSVLLPALLVSSIGSVNLAALPLGALAGTIWGSLAIGAVLSLVLARALGHGHATATSVLQGGIRYNNLLAFAVAGAIHGPAGIAVGGIATGLIVPFVQVVITIVFAVGGSARPSPRRVARQLVTNPLLQACAAGMVLALLGGPPPGLSGLLRGLAQGSLAVGLLCVGAALTPGALQAQPVTQLLTGVLKLLLMPLIALGLAASLGLEALALTVAVLFMAQPTATTSYVQARGMGGDAPLMAAMITTQHLAAMVTLPLWVLLLAR
ncbi:auxin efflux carrier [Pseudoroseomonas deserti]|uniref:Auxin efflux carrier n=1 Tax=Teichococcus deserti TaxID=1817963 RepID=A0A1V2H0B6_9PROT|nr:AEC family transporter [Pseudoroseomonas deserti]ONG50498.1 auxin efflux carrier [Pseudoroseomonas deserti]